MKKEVIFGRIGIQDHLGSLTREQAESLRDGINGAGEAELRRRKARVKTASGWAAITGPARIDGDDLIVTVAEE